MAVEKDNPRDFPETMGNDGTKADGSDSKRASAIPAYTTYENYDVFSGGKGLSQKEYMTSTFHTSDMTEGDASFRSKAELMEGSAPELIGEVDRFETTADEKEQTQVEEQAKEAAL